MKCVLANDIKSKKQMPLNYVFSLVVAASPG